MNYKTVITSCGLLMVFFTSCSQIVNPSVIATVQPPTPAQIQTLQSLPTPVNVFEYPDQVTDGQLLLSIDEIEQVCHKISESFQIRFSFTNITDKKINLPDNFSVAENRRGDGGDLIPLITTLTGTDIYSLADFNIVDIFNPPSNSFTMVSASQTVDFVVDFRFPDPLAELLSDGTKKLSPPDPGQYIIRFVYIERPREIDTWSGAIGSNRLEICIVN